MEGVFVETSPVHQFSTTFLTPDIVFVVGRGLVRSVSVQVRRPTGGFVGVLVTSVVPEDVTEVGDILELSGTRVTLSLPTPSGSLVVRVVCLGQVTSTSVTEDLHLSGTFPVGSGLNARVARVVPESFDTQRLSVETKTSSVLFVVTIVTRSGGALMVVGAVGSSPVALTESLRQVKKKGAEVGRLFPVIVRLGTFFVVGAFVIFIEDVSLEGVCPNIPNSLQVR